MEKLYARDIYGQTLVAIGKADSRIVVLDADLSGSTRTAIFAKEFPERFFNFGVAEQGMMTAAAGLASCGKIVFASTFAMFASARALDQVRNSICYNNFNVKIVATHAGITVGEDGASHQALEDVNFFRAIPNMTIIAPCDGPEAGDAIMAAYKSEGPFYIRLGRSKVPTIENRPQFIIGKGYALTQGDDLAIVTYGLMINEALGAQKILKEQGISVRVVNMHTIKPLDYELVISLAKKYKKILICEEHQVTGGLFSAIAEVVSRKSNTQLERIGVEDRFGQSGSPEELMEYYGLSANNIAKKAVEFIRS